MEYPHAITTPIRGEGVAITQNNSFSLWYVFDCANVPYFVYHFAVLGKLSSFLLWAIINRTAGFVVIFLGWHMCSFMLDIFLAQKLLGHRVFIICPGLHNAAKAFSEAISPVAVPSRVWKLFDEHVLSAQGNEFSHDRLMHATAFDHIHSSYSFLSLSSISPHTYLPVLPTHKRESPVFLGLAYHSDHNDLWFNPFLCTWHHFIPLCGWIKLYCVGIAYFIHSAGNQHPDWFCDWASVNITVINTWV